MGPMDVRQKKVLGVFLVTIFFWMTGEWFHLDTTTVCLAGAMLLLLPKVEVLDWRTVISHLNYNVLFIAGGGLSLGNLLLKNGTAAWLANCIFLSFPCSSCPQWFSWPVCSFSASSSMFFRGDHSDVHHTPPHHPDPEPGCGLSRTCHGFCRLYGDQRLPRPPVLLHHFQYPGLWHRKSAFLGFSADRAAHFPAGLFGLHSVESYHILKNPKVLFCKLFYNTSIL